MIYIYNYLIAIIYYYLSISICFISIFTSPTAFKLTEVICVSTSLIFPIEKKSPRTTERTFENAFDYTYFLI